MKEFGKDPLISIIVPVYNGSGYLDDLFARFAGQPTDEIELVLIDDGSRDDSYARLLTWQKKADFAVSVYHQENRGVSAARNFGVEMARGRYITFLDVDDGIAADYLSVLLPYARQEIRVLVFDSRPVKAGEPETGRSGGSCAKITKQEMLTEFLYDPTRFGVYNLLVNKAYLTAHSIRFPVGYKYYEDYDYLLQVFAQTQELTRLERVLYFYILREGSAMGRFNADRINCLRIMKSREAWLETCAPEFAPMFARWGVARLYWSVLWQAALSFSSYGEFCQFAAVTHGKRYLVKLKGYPDKLIQISTRLFLWCRPAYYLAVRLAGRTKSRVAPSKLGDILPGLMEIDDIQ